MKETQLKPTGYNAPAISKATQIMKIISAEEKGLGVSELARMSGFSKSTIFGLTRALLNEGLLRQDASGKKYFLGSTLFELAMADWNYIKVNLDVQPFLDELKDRIRETVCLGVINRDKVLIMATSEASKPLKISASAGSMIPLLPGAIGKAVLSRYEPDQSRKIIEKNGLKPLTPNSITDPNQYLDCVARVRESGYAVDNEEYIQGVRAVAVSLDNTKGLPMAIWAVGFTSSMTSEKLAGIANEIMRTANLIKKQLKSWL